MTDEELIARLRDAPADGLGTENLCIAAADRIEALVKERDEHRRNWNQAFNTNAALLERAERLEAAVKRVVDLLDDLTERQWVIDGLTMSELKEITDAIDAVMKGGDHE